MKAELYKRLFKAIYTEDIVSLKKIAITIIQEERKLGHNVLADSLEKLTITEKPKYTLFDSRRNETGLASLPKSKRNNSQLVSYIPREQLKHHMVLPEGVEERLLSIEQEYAARERLKRKKGTLQKDWCIIKSNQLSDAFCVAVRGHKGWGGLFKAKYSLAVSFEAINQDIPIYEPIRTEIETTIENKEIEVEMPDSK